MNIAAAPKGALFLRYMTTAQNSVRAAVSFSHTNDDRPAHTGNARNALARASNAVSYVDRALALGYLNSDDALSFGETAATHLRRGADLLKEFAANSQPLWDEPALIAALGKANGRFQDADLHIREARAAMGSGAST